MQRIPTLVAFTLLGFGCGHKPLTTAIAHPAVAGRIDEHAIEVPDKVGDRGYRVGAFGVKKHMGPEVSRGTLTDRVRLVRLDATAICFDFEVVARQPDEPAFAAPGQATIVAPKGHDSLRPQVEPKDIRAMEMSGMYPEHLEQGAAEYPGDDGYRLVRGTARVVVHTGGAKVCFANEGIVTPQTHEIRLRTPTGDYLWQLQGDAKAWPAETIVYGAEIKPHLRLDPAPRSPAS